MMKVQWEEPVEFFQAYLQETGSIPSPRNRILAGVAAAAFVALLVLGFEWFFFWLHQKDLGVPLWVYFVAPGISGVVVWFFPVMLMATPATIVLDEEGLHRIKPVGSQLTVTHWPWENLAELTLDEVRYGQKVFPVLVVRTAPEGEEMLFGVGGAPLDRLRELATHRGRTIGDRPG
ncbi:hypothetical protein [Lignipirellula cremea]|uniref:Uncharacterized protein n=1 Tax=Lignipirellula cremea TaxID=2528010 RepID=A0A518DUU4_9BACT|nr:hypothetical protein [Lignipirellula cremea]QDU95606.1 hypothetical protein Pla8534_34220 [Lignipirellula cremea]